MRRGHPGHYRWMTGHEGRLGRQAGAVAALAVFHLYFVDSASAEMPVACLAHPRGKQPRKRKKRGHILRAAGADAPLKPDDDERRYRGLLSAGGLLLNLVPRMLKLTPI